MDVLFFIGLACRFCRHDGVSLESKQFGYVGGIIKCGADTLVVSPYEAMCISKCVMARAQTSRQMIAVHSFVQSEANVHQTKNLRYLEKSS